MSVKVVCTKRAASIDHTHSNIYFFDINIVQNVCEDAAVQRDALRLSRLLKKEKKIFPPFITHNAGHTRDHREARLPIFTSSIKHRNIYMSQPHVYMHI